eukprot:TRINITY_DN4733_c0_g1_i3.p1 TRINITY_DN4733_c0_g1~~TRINITY_DN4733_c0_g1_i3.p1  ORF type:complete len:314 (-),score=63.90 TRINITY_DN4733_c0_g1_i3:161-1102(-)
MFVPSSYGAALPLVIVCLPAWALFPTLRTKCAATVPAFAALNISGQLGAAVLWALTLGMLGASQGRFVGHLHTLELDWHVGAVMLGGFCLGHADHMGAVSMQMIPAAVAYPIYAGVTVVGGSALNYMQAQPARVPYWVVGQALVLLAVLQLSTMQKLDQHRAGEHRLLTGEEEGEETKEWPEPKLSDQQAKTTRTALVVCLCAGLCGSLWSPLSTFARKSDQLKDDPYLCLFLFVSGEVCSWPTVALLSWRIGGHSVCRSFEELRPSQVAWGLLTGLNASIGYIGYFLGSSYISPTVRCSAVQVCFGLSLIHI